MNNKKKYLIAITGNSGCGKSTVLNIIKNLGYATFDSDFLSIQTILNSDIVIEHLSSLLKNEIIFNNIDLKKIGIFFENNLQQEEKFEKWYQPFLGLKIRNICDSTSTMGLVFFDVPFLYQKGILDLFDEIWIIETDISIAYKRIKKRNPTYSNDKIKYIIRRSLTNKEVYKHAKTIIKNNGTVNELKLKIISNIKNII